MTTDIQQYDVTFHELMQNTLQQYATRSLTLPEPNVHVQTVNRAIADGHASFEHVPFAEKERILYQASMHMNLPEPTHRLQCVHAAHNSLLYRLTMDENIMYYWLPFYSFETDEPDNALIIIAHRAFLNETHITCDNTHNLQPIVATIMRDKDALTPLQQAMHAVLSCVYQYMDLREHTRHLLAQMNDNVMKELPDRFIDIASHITKQHGTKVYLKVGDITGTYDILSRNEDNANLN